MGSSNQTAHFGLNQWVEDDPVLREDFNADNQKLDAVLHKITPVFGSYIGAGMSKEIILGFRPSYVFVKANTNAYTLPPRTSGSDSGAATGEASNAYLEITNEGFRVSASFNYSDTSNYNGEIGSKAPYRYIAYR